MKKKHIAVLNRITASIPQQLLDNLIRVEPLTPTIKKVFQEGVKSKDIRPELKARMQSMLDAEMLDEKIEIVNRDVEQQIEDYLDGEIKKAIKKGELPPITKSMAIHKKLRKYYGRRNTEQGSNR